MKYILILLLAFAVSVYSQNVKKVKLFINNNSDLQKANSLSIDLEHSVLDKNGGLILFLD